VAGLSSSSPIAVCPTSPSWRLRQSGSGIEVNREVGVCFLARRGGLYSLVPPLYPLLSSPLSPLSPPSPPLFPSRSRCGGCSGSLTRVCCRCLDARALCSDYRMIFRKFRGSFAKSCYSPDQDRSCA
jgi:hypothetical protein